MNEQDLFNIPVPQPTASYSPVSHRQIIEQIRENVDKSSLQIVGSNYQATGNGKAMVGTFDLQAESDTFNYRLAFRNSYDKSMSIAFVGGVSVMICSNGMILGDIKFLRRHTGTVASELNEKIERVIGNLDEELEMANRHGDQMRSIELNPTSTAELCGRFLMEQEIITSSQLTIIRDQLKRPDYEDFADPTLWSLYNHATHALKKTHPYNYIDAYKKLHNFVETEFSLV